MLNLPRLDDLDYQKLWDRARAMAPVLAPEWTDLNDHDPGVTTLQAFAWLCDSLNYYINATGEAHRLAYLKLLGIRPRRSPARCRVEFRAPSGAALSLPAGTRLLAGDTVFELERAVEGRANRLIRLYSEESGRCYDLGPFVEADGGFAPILTDEPSRPAEAFFGFAEPLSGTVRLFIPVAGTGRNPFGDDFSLVQLEWSCRDGGGWQRAEVLSDETRGLLRSGFLTLRLSGETALYENGRLAPAHYLRCALRQGCYDRRPRVGRAAVCCGTAVQTDTAAHTVELLYRGEPSLPVGYALESEDRVSVAVREQDEWVVWRDFRPSGDDLCAVEDGAVRFHKKRFGRVPAKGSRVLVTIARPGAPLLLGETDGCASRRVALDPDGLCRLRLALSRTGPDGRRAFEIYDECPDLSGAGRDDRVFQLDRREGSVVFGDGVHGVQPEAGLLVEALELARSSFGGGNVLRGQVNRLETPVEGVTAENLEDAGGGEYRCTSEELEPLVEEKLRAVLRAVTAEDIRALTLGTPGLLIEDAAVIPMADYCAAAGEAPPPVNTILIAVRPKSERRLPILSEDYARIIRAYLGRHRMLANDLQVRPARYVGVGVYGRIRLADPGRAAEDGVLEALRVWIESENPVFGRRVDYGGLFSRLELLPAVRAVSQLSLEYLGEGGRKNEHGDILLLPDCLAYLWETGIEFV